MYAKTLLEFFILICKISVNVLKIWMKNVEINLKLWKFFLQKSGINCMKLCTRTVHFVLHHSNVIRIFHTQILLYWSVSVWMMAIAVPRCSILGNFYFAGISAKNFDGHLFEKLAFVTEPNIIVMQDFYLKSIIILSRFTQKMIFT